MAKLCRLIWGGGGDVRRGRTGGVGDDLILFGFFVMYRGTKYRWSTRYFGFGGFGVEVGVFVGGGVVERSIH